jgi:hypothetical protein
MFESADLMSYIFNIVSNGKHLGEINVPCQETTMREADAADAGEVIALWEACGLTRPWNDAAADFARAVAGPASAVLVLREGDELGPASWSAMTAIAAGSIISPWRRRGGGPAWGGG